MRCAPVSGWCGRNVTMPRPMITPSCQTAKCRRMRCGLSRYSDHTSGSDIASRSVPTV